MLCRGFDLALPTDKTGNRLAVVLEVALVVVEVWTTGAITGATTGAIEDVGKEAIEDVGEEAIDCSKINSCWERSSKL